MKRILVALAVAVLAAALWVMFLIPSREIRDIESIFADMLGGEGGIATLKAPDRVEAHRVKFDFATGYDPHNYKVTSVAVPVSHEVVTGIVDALFRLKSYVGEGKKMCSPNYGVRLTFHRENDRVEVFLCFECDILLVVRNGSITGGENFDEIHDDLLRVVKALFPNDREIQDFKRPWE